MIVIALYGDYLFLSAVKAYFVSFATDYILALVAHLKGSNGNETDNIEQFENTAVTLIKRDFQRVIDYGVFAFAKSVFHIADSLWLCHLEGDVPSLRYKS